MGHILRMQFIRVPIICGLLFLCSCISVQKLKTNYLASSFESAIESLYSQPDPELVKEALPSFLILLDSLILSSPDNAKLLYAGTLAYGTYCQAFLSNEEDIKRAAKLYAKAKEYGFRLLNQESNLYNITESSFSEFEDQLKLATHVDVPYLFATSSAWLGWILSNSGSMEAIADLPKAISMINRVVELDEKYNNGAAHLVFGIYFAAQPRGAGQDLEKSKRHFDRAVELGGDGNLLPIVTFAEYYARATLDESLFANLLTKAVEMDIESRPDIRLLNEIALERANFLMENKEDFF